MPLEHWPPASCLACCDPADPAATQPPLRGSDQYPPPPGLQSGKPRLSEVSPLGAGHKAPGDCARSRLPPPTHARPRQFSGVGTSSLNSWLRGVAPGNEISLLRWTWGSAGLEGPEEEPLGR